MSKIAVIGDGGWGTALALQLHAQGHAVRVWGPFADGIAQIRAARENEPFLPGVPIPEGIAWTADRAAAVAQCELAVLAVPTKYFPGVLRSFAGILPAACPVVSVAKGLDAETHERMSEVARRILGSAAVAALSGPSHAEEVARGIPTAVVAASTDAALCRHVQKTFAGQRLRVYTSQDVTGVELGGALKNVIAVAVGMSDGLGFGDNTRAALITRGLAEIMRLGCALGAEASTFAGLSGMGDLIVTCTSRHSRNRGVGERIGRGEAVDAILADSKQAVEGVWNCASARALAEARGVNVPITEEVYAIVHAGRRPQEAVQTLLERELKPE